MSEMTWVTKELTCVQWSDSKHTRQLGLGYKQSGVIQLWIRFALIVFTRRHRIWLSITLVTLTLFTWTPLNSMVVPMTNKEERKLRNNYVFTLHSLHAMSSHVIVFNVNIFTDHHCFQCFHTFLGVISGR